MSNSQSSKEDYLYKAKQLRENFKGKKLHRMRAPVNSYLTDAMEANGLDTFLAIFRSIVISLVVLTLLYYRADPSKLWMDLDSLKWNLSKYPYFIMFILLFHSLAFVSYEGFKLWINIRTLFQSKVVDKVFLLVYVASYCFTLVISGYYMLHLDLRPIFGLAAGMEQGRMFMKIYSFVRECAPRVLKHEPEKDGNQEHALCPTRKHYLYFLFAPTLLYKDSYSRTEKTQWNHFFFNIFQFLLSFVFVYCMTFRYRELFINVGLRPFTPTEKVLVISASTLYGSVLICVFSYSFLHCWQNIFAEILRFGEREFYSDWWNSENGSDYYRKWNTIVSDWFYTYCYMDLQMLGYRSDFSRLMVFILSFVFHDYVVSLCVGCFYPLIGFIFSLGGIVLIPLTYGAKGLQMRIILWSMLFLVGQMMTYNLTTEKFSRLNCPKNETLIDFFLPRMFDPSCPITSS